jgi:LuxR family maltose regulon positive regulatory protein
MPNDDQHGWRRFAPTSEPIMSAKFEVALVKPWMVQRPRLLQLLSQGVSGPLTLVRAPAGSGKTVLAGSWVAAGLSPGPVAWVTLDQDDHQSGLFWSYVLAAMSRVGVTLPIEAPTDVTAVEHATLIQLAACLSERTEPVVLVIDNGHVLTGSIVPTEIDFLIHHAGPQLRVVLMTRSDPEIPLHRYVVAGDVTEIWPHQLAFTEAEVGALLETHGITVAPDALAALVENTKGWAVSLRFAALALQHHAEDPVSDGESDGDLDVADYFRTEVLDAQDAIVRDFLLRTSVVDRIWPGLAVQLVGDARAERTMATISQAGTFLDPVDGEDGGYEYQPLVRTLLRAQLVDESPTRTRRLHRKAAAWFATQHRLEEAIDHAVKAGDWAFAATLVVRGMFIGTVLCGKRRSALASRLSAMPPEVPGAEAAVIRAAFAVGESDRDTVAAELRTARELAASGSAEDWLLHLAVDATGLAMATTSGDAELALVFADAAEDAIRELSVRETPVPAPMLAVVLANKGVALLRSGELDDAAETLANAIPPAATPDCADLRLMVLGQLALAEALRGRLRKSAEVARQAWSLSEKPGVASGERPAAVDIALAWVSAEEYDLTAARGHLSRVPLNAGLRADPVAAGMAALVRARLRRAHGDVAGAAAAIADAKLGALTPSVPAWLTLMHRPYSVAPPRQAQARSLDGDAGAQDVEAGSDLVVIEESGDSPRQLIFLAAAQLSAGAAVAADTAVTLLLRRKDLPLDVAIDAWLLSASCKLAEGHGEQARTALDQALRLAAPEGLRRPFVEAPTPVRRLLREDQALTTRYGWLGTAIPGPPRPRTASAQPTRSDRAEDLVIESLTARETEVLGYLAALLSNDEIARSMLVSVNTVKTHVRSVLRKLAATRRNEAIRRARELGLL